MRLVYILAHMSNTDKEGAMPDPSAELTPSSPRNNPDYLPVHKDVVAAWLRHTAGDKSDDGWDSRYNDILVSQEAHPLPKPPEPPKHEQAIELLGDEWALDERPPFYHFSLNGVKIGWISKSNPNTPAQIADALRVLAGEAV